MAKKDKFEFDPDFQELILRYTVMDKKGYKAINLYSDEYFTMLNHAVVAFALKKYYKKYKRIPDKTFLKESLRSLYSSNQDFGKISKEEKREVQETVDRLYGSPVEGGEEIMEKIVKFAQFVNFKEQLEQIDVLNYDSYEASISALRNAINIGRNEEKKIGTYVVSGIKDRAHKRDLHKQSFETPFWQFNRLLNGGGITPAALIMVAGEAKRFKTGFLLNLCKFYLRRKKKVVYFDFENSEEALVIRSEQSILGTSQEDIASGVMDDRLLKLMRKYERLGAELFVVRFPAYTTNCADLQAFLDKEKQERGFEPQMAIFDGPDLMGSNSGDKDDFTRISNVYLDIKNMGEFNKWESMWVPSHTKGNAMAMKHRATRYNQFDLAKCIDKIRHVDIALGLQESKDEIDANIIRMEIIEIRNGKKGKVMFWVDWEKQGMKEFTRAELKDYEEQFKVRYDDENDPSEFDQPKKRERKTDME